ncbi:unnamed protein product [Caenorhabditis auriculariae]|uniref:HotDog ACOT-type domain-containing protein n=1 Tax=Caenorhabditis auriculariae TaxID=2777116 RepID=A0A8S1H4F0_9PELO|nr:unnamed protein product [Caenorhabditis auriculariae]
MSLNRTASSAVNAAKSSRGLIQQTKQYRPMKKTIEKEQLLRSMNDIYSCFHGYARNLNAPTPKYFADVLHQRESSDSELNVVLPLSTDPVLRQQMINERGHVRVGRLLEHMDIVAPCCGYMLNRADVNDIQFQTGSLPRMLVTSRIHSMDVRKCSSIDMTQDISLHGKVTWTGMFSTEVTVSVHQHGDCKLEGQFVFISLDAKNPRKKYAVNQLIPTNDLEEQTIEMRQRQYLEPRVPPTPTVLEQPLIKENQVKMSSTRVEHTMVVQPENENPYGTTFGGFLLRQGLETAEACARLFAKGPVKLSSVDDSQFINIVDIGSIIRFSSVVSDVVPGKIQVFSLAEVFDQALQKFKPCDKFYFSFDAQTEKLPEVIPCNVQEYIAQKTSRESRKLGLSRQ